MLVQYLRVLHTDCSGSLCSHNHSSVSGPACLTTYLLAVRSTKLVKKSNMWRPRSVYLLHVQSFVPTRNLVIRDIGNVPCNLAASINNGDGNGMAGHTVGKSYFFLLHSKLSFLASLDRQMIPRFKLPGKYSVMITRSSSYWSSHEYTHTCLFVCVDIPVTRDPLRLRLYIQYFYER